MISTPDNSRDMFHLVPQIGIFPKFTRTSVFVKTGAQKRLHGKLHKFGFYLVDGPAFFPVRTGITFSLFEVAGKHFITAAVGRLNLHKDGG